MTGSSTDPWVIRAIASGLLAVTLTIVLGAIWLASRGRAVPDSLIALGGTSLGGITAFLVSTRSATTETQAVNVVNSPSEPVPVEPGA